MRAQPLPLSMSLIRVAHFLQLKLHRYIIITQSPQLALGFTPGAARSMTLDKRVMMCADHCSVVQSVFTVLTILCAWLFISCQPLAATDLFTVLTVLPFLECHRVKLMQYASCSDWLLSPSTMHLRFFHGFSRLDSSFFWHWMRFHCLNVLQFVYPFTYWRAAGLLPSSGNCEWGLFFLFQKAVCYQHFSVPRTNTGQKFSGWGWTWQDRRMPLSAGTHCPEIFTQTYIRMLRKCQRTYLSIIHYFTHVASPPCSYAETSEY